MLFYLCLCMWLRLQWLQINSQVLVCWFCNRMFRFLFFIFMPVKYTVTLCLICAFSTAWACVCVSVHFIVGCHHQNLAELVLGVCESMRESACVWKFVCKLCMSQFEKRVCSCVKVHLNSVCEVCVRTCFSSHKCVKVRSSSCAWRCVEGVLNFMCMWKYGCVKMHWCSFTFESMCVRR